MKSYHIVLNLKAGPVVHASRAVPGSLNKIFKDELEQTLVAYCLQKNLQNG